MKRMIAIVTLAVAGFMTAGPAIAQQRPQSPVAVQGQRQAQPQGQRQAPPARPMYQRGDTWYEFLLKQFNPGNFDYGAWMEERRQVFLDASVRNPYFKYSLGTTIALLIMAMLYTKQWIDHRRAMWITAEMMTDLYNHDLYSRDVAEKAMGVALDAFGAEDQRFRQGPKSVQTRAQRLRRGDDEQGVAYLYYMGMSFLVPSMREIDFGF